MQLIDLTMPVSDHFRWRVDRRLASDFDKGDQFQVTWIGWPVHGFTHIDSGRHILSAGFTTDDISLEQLTGEASIVDLSSIQPDSEISAAQLAQHGGHVEERDIVVLAAHWDKRRSIASEAFWTDAPYLSREACQWLLDRKPKAVGFDFPQDRPIRNLLFGRVDPLTEYVSHDVLLRNGVVLMEYLCNLAAIPSKRTIIIALPLKLPQADGAPARIVALTL